MMGAVLTAGTLAQMLPMHLWLGADGTVLSVGPTLAKLLPGLPSGLDGQLVAGRGGAGSCALAAIIEAVDRRDRLFLRVVPAQDMVLRGHGIRVGDQSILVNLGFGIGLHRAIRSAGLTVADFAPSELAMELLFLHEANLGVRMELSRFNKQLAQSREVALQQAQTDPLTGLHNRRGLEMALALALHAPAGSVQPAAPFTLMHLDLDYFKHVNDQLGHQAGDDLLRSVASVLRAHVRKDDTAARIGGDEFVMILKGMTARAALENLADRIIAAIRALSPPHLTHCAVSASLGIIMWTPDSPALPEEVMALADKALYQSKGAGRGCATIL